MAKVTYKDAGVDIDEGARAVNAIKEAVRSTYTPEVLGDLGGFGGLFSAAALCEMSDPILVSGTDGVGTKLELAKRLHSHNSIGIDLVAMCVNDIVTCGARPLFFLDYLAIGRLQAEFAAEVVGGIAEGCRIAGCALIGGEMAEHPGVMAPDDYDVSGFAVGVVDRPLMIDPEHVQAGDVLLGLASSGLHSNGYSLVRRALTDDLSDAEMAKATLSDGSSLARALLAPTQIYVAPLLEGIAKFNHPTSAPGSNCEGGIHAAAHITGGGITENLNRALPAGLNALVNKSWPVPAVIQAVVEAAQLQPEQALTTFNMGIGMVLVVAAAAAQEIEAFYAERTDIGAIYRIGEVVPINPDGQLTVEPQVLYEGW